MSLYSVDGQAGQKSHDPLNRLDYVPSASSRDIERVLFRSGSFSGLCSDYQEEKKQTYAVSIDLAYALESLRCITIPCLACQINASLVRCANADTLIKESGFKEAIVELDENDILGCNPKVASLQ